VVVRDIVGREEHSRLVYSTGGLEPAGEQRTQARGAGARGIRLRLDRRAGGRVVTLVTGLPGNETEMLTLARALKSACGVGGTVKRGELQLQGDQRDSVEAALHARGLKSKRAGG
jgi:translation initiation factor 1